VGGAIRVLAGSVLDVWVEDARAECRGRDLAVASYYGSQGTTEWPWATTAQLVPGMSVALATVEPKERLRVVAAVEGTADRAPTSICGATSGTLVAQTTLDGAAMATIQQPMPPSGGQVHLVLNTFAAGHEVRNVDPGEHRAKLYAGKNFTSSRVFTGGCCGEAMLGLLREADATLARAGEHLHTPAR
jgi:hypothetical protein